MKHSNLSILEGLATLIGSHLTREPTASPVLTKWWKWELILATNFGSLCPEVTNYGSQNFGYQIWFVPDCLKYREYLQKLYSLDTWCLTEKTNLLRSDTTSNRINHTACPIWPTMLHISCALINSSTLKTSSISTNSWDPWLFKTLQETSYILLGVLINFSFMIHLMPIWYFESFWTHHPYDNIINIKVHKYFALCLKISYDR